MDNETHKKHLSRALQIAERGIGLVSPNPLVGCVVVSEGGAIVGEGAYKYDNVVHAEAIAIREAGIEARGGTVYVSLEPHAHHGRTPSCADLMIDAGIRRVVCPIEDPNPLVSGRGFAKLREANIEVVTGILATVASQLNEKFICWHEKKRPFVHLKLAVSLDGRISLEKSVSTALSGSEAIKRVHEMRHEHDAILVGANTASVDNPKLTDRSGKPRRRKLIRVVLDEKLRINEDSVLVKTAEECPTIVFTNSPDADRKLQFHDRCVEVVEVETCRDLASVLDELKKREIQSVLVEGGSAIAGAFVDARLVDKMTFIISPLIVGGADAPVAIGGRGAAKLEAVVRLRDVTTTQLGGDIEITGYPYPVHKPARSKGDIRGLDIPPLLRAGLRHDAD